MHALKSDHRFTPAHFGMFQDLRKTRNSKAPGILLVACADHGTVSDDLSFAVTHPMQIVQNMGGSIPTPGDLSAESTLASIQVAICVTQVRHVIICGHLGCGLIARWFEKPQDRPQTAEGQLFSEVVYQVERSYPQAGRLERFELTVREHLLRQLDNFVLHDFIQDRLRDNQLRLHCWLVDDETSRIQTFDPHTGQFVPVEGT